LNAALLPLPAGVEERGEMLDRSQLFKGFTWADLQVFARYFEAVRAPRAAVVFAEGAREGSLFLLIKGKIDITKESAAKNRATLASVSTGKCFGEMALIDGEPRSATAVAAEDSELLVLSRENFERLTEEAPRLAVALLLRIASLISQRLRQTSGTLVDYLKD